MSLGPMFGDEVIAQSNPVIVPTLKERLGIAVTNAENQLKVAKEARDILDKHPELERLIDLLQIGRF